MSVVIANGYRYKGTLMNLLKILEEIRADFRKKAVDYTMELYNKNIYKLLYFATNEGLTDEELIKAFLLESPKDLTRDLFIVAEDKCRKVEEKFLKFEECKINIYPMSNNEFLICTFYTTMTKDFTNFKDYFEEYSFWNNTDIPDRISDKEWRERERKWSKVFNNGYGFYESGLTFHLITEKSFLTVFLDEETLKKVQNYNTKDNIEAIQKHLNTYSKVNNHDFYYDKLIDNINTSLLFKSVKEVRNLMKEKKI